jgi:hypothetical protein
MYKITTFAWIKRDDYTVSMSISPRINTLLMSKTANSIFVSIFYASILAVLAVTQILTFSDFQLTIKSFWLPGGTPFAYFLSGLVIIAEVLAVPFLLRIKTSTFMRVFSMILSWFVPLFWLSISVWLLTTVNAVSNVGLLGSVVRLAPGWWLVIFGTMTAVLAIWASWSMWPPVRKQTK